MESFKLTKKALVLSVACALAVVGCKKNEEQPAAEKKSVEVDDAAQAKSVEMAKPKVEPKADVTTEQNANVKTDSVKTDSVNADTEVTTQQDETLAAKKAAEQASAKKKAAGQAAARKKAAEQAAARKKAAEQAAARKKAAEQAAARKKAAERPQPKVKAGPTPKVVEAKTNNLKAPTDDSVKLEIVTSDDTY